MDKKVLAGILESIVNQVAATNNVQPVVARALVGSLIEGIKDQIATACKVPTLQLPVAAS